MQKNLGLSVVGWREEVTLPDFRLKDIKAKIDTGAKTSALHAKEIKYTRVNGKKHVSFIVEHDDGKKTHLEVPLLDEREIRSSTGEKTLRPVVKTIIKMGEVEFKAEITLINRDLMGFKMLIGREALNNRFIIHPSKSFFLKKIKIKEDKK